MKGEVKSYAAKNSDGNIVGSFITDDNAPSETELIVQ